MTAKHIKVLCSKAADIWKYNLGLICFVMIYIILNFTLKQFWTFTLRQFRTICEASMYDIIYGEHHVITQLPVCDHHMTIYLELHCLMIEISHIAYNTVIGVPGRRSACFNLFRKYTLIWLNGRNLVSTFT